MSPVDRDARLRRLESQLDSVQSQRELVELVAAEVRNTIGYMTTWLGVFLEHDNTYKILAPELAGGDDLWDSAVALPIEGDHYVTRLTTEQKTQIVVDAQVDPNVNREIVEQLGNRTTINVPIFVDDVFFGSLGTGTFGDEGPRPPDESEVEYLENVAGIAGASLSRILRLAGHIA